MDLRQPALGLSLHLPQLKRDYHLGLETLLSGYMLRDDKVNKTK